MKSGGGSELSEDEEDALPICISRQLLVGAGSVSLLRRWMAHDYALARLDAARLGSSST